MLADLLKIHCLTHKATFPMERANRVVICREGPTQHRLGADFPRQGQWLYCCHCQTFLAWEPESAAPKLASCPVCRSWQNLRLFACAECGVTMMDFDEAALRKPYAVLSWGLPQPACPGCQSAQPASTQTHFCPAVEARLATARTLCPFCAKPIISSNPAMSEATIISVPQSIPPAPLAANGNSAALPLRVTDQLETQYISVSAADPEPLRLALAEPDQAAAAPMALIELRQKGPLRATKEIAKSPPLVASLSAAGALVSSPELALQMAAPAPSEAYSPGAVATGNADKVTEPDASAPESLLYVQLGQTFIHHGDELGWRALLVKAVKVALVAFLFGLLLMLGAVIVRLITE